MGRTKNTTDSKLLGEIHVSLLKSIIKDIEDVARTPVIGLGANQNSAANPGEGHPQIVEGAFAWGFDICSWQRHLNFFTSLEENAARFCTYFFLKILYLFIDTNKKERKEKRNIHQTFFILMFIHVNAC